QHTRLLVVPYTTLFRSQWRVDMQGEGRNAVAACSDVLYPYPDYLTVGSVVGRIIGDSWCSCLSRSFGSKVMDRIIGIRAVQSIKDDSIMNGKINSRYPVLVVVVLIT